MNGAQEVACGLVVSRRNGLVLLEPREEVLDEVTRLVQVAREGITASFPLCSSGSMIGVDMGCFATPGHLLSWACLCPRSDERARKRRSTRLRRGGVWLKTTLVQVAWAGVKVKGGYLQAQFHRIRARRGAKKAIIAVAASMLTAAWHMLKDGTEWHDLGAAHFDRANAEKTANRLIRRLQQIGYTVQAVSN